MPELELILCIVNKGYSEAVMDAATAAGAGGGTIFSGRGLSNPEAEKLFNISIDPEKEIIMIVAVKEKIDTLLKVINETAGWMTSGHGIAFTLPVDRIVGLPEKQFK